MKASIAVLCGILVIAGGGVANAQPTGDERALVGATWSGGETEDVPGYESWGGSYVGDPLAVSLFRSSSNPRDWIVVSKREVGRDGQHALWRGLDTIRLNAASSETFVAFECRRGGATGEFAPEAGLIGFVGRSEAAPGLLQAEQAVQVGAEGQLSRVEAPVVCADEGAGI
ncbi:MAG: hypothetical protein REJ23_09255 [Brevundimonas sp.]|nr:hypothetical protein [Brevundimonas sp.]